MNTIAVNLEAEREFAKHLRKYLDDVGVIDKPNCWYEMSMYVACDTVDTVVYGLRVTECDGLTG